MPAIVPLGTLERRADALCVFYIGEKEYFRHIPWSAHPYQRLQSAIHLGKSRCSESSFIFIGLWRVSSLTGRDSTQSCLRFFMWKKYASPTPNTLVLVFCKGLHLTEVTAVWDSLYTRATIFSFIKKREYFNFGRRVTWGHCCSLWQYTHCRDRTWRWIPHQAGTYCRDSWPRTSWNLGRWVMGKVLKLGRVQMLLWGSVD